MSRTSLLTKLRGAPPLVHVSRTEDRERVVPLDARERRLHRDLAARRSPALEPGSPIARRVLVRRADEQVLPALDRREALLLLDAIRQRPRVAVRGKVDPHLPPGR